MLNTIKIRAWVELFLAHPVHSITCVCRRTDADWSWLQLEMVRPTGDTSLCLFI